MHIRTAKNYCSKLFHSLNNIGINYCHWKSNAHLHDALNGNTDLDILVELNDKYKFEGILKEYNTIQVISKL